MGPQVFEIHYRYLGECGGMVWSKVFIEAYSREEAFGRYESFRLAYNKTTVFKWDPVAMSDVYHAMIKFIRDKTLIETALKITHAGKTI